MSESTLNARVAAVALASGAGVLHLLNQLEHSLLPLRLLTIGVLILGAWAFSDEMGMRKPLNRAAFVCFMFSMTSLAAALLDAGAPMPGPFHLIYALTLLFAVLTWSGAFLHRRKSLKVVGALGAVAAILPVVVIVAGHVSVGAAAYFGLRNLLDPSRGVTALGSVPVNVVEAVFLVWAVVTALMLWRGGMSEDARARTPVA